jgi:hypothetical protein
MEKYCDSSKLGCARSYSRGRLGRCCTILMTAIVIAACEPHGPTPGQWLRGTVVDPLPQEWAFTDDYQEVFVEVSTPYFIPHSVTIWCVHVDGNLFIAARDPDTKNWPGWINDNRDIRVKIGDKLYDVAAADLSDEATLVSVRLAYEEKYNLPKPADGDVSNVRYWAIDPR